MIILRKILKVVLLPISLLLLAIKLTLKLAEKASEVVLGLLILLVGFGTVYSICTQNWTNLLIFAIIGARIYSLNYYTFVKLAKRAGANIRIKKNVVIDLNKIEEFLEQNCKAENGGFDDV